MHDLIVFMEREEETKRAADSDGSAPDEAARTRPGLDPVEEASEESFPASDAPSWEPLHIGGRPW